MARQILWWTAAGVIVAVALVAVGYSLDMHRAYERVRASGTVITSAYIVVQQDGLTKTQAWISDAFSYHQKL